ncbi:MAG: histidine triad nucleotide-binding protein [Holosporales bacterium]|jgi:diadenosine tetraphosphate (Ap4A) HIT family hydrolase|nr:histidine triad nucleotide-binding protein [Holosporales bacterium]
MLKEYDRNNVFAKILRGEAKCSKVFESDDVLAIRDIFPKAPQHILVLPKGEYTCMTDFIEHSSDAQIAAYFRAVVKIAKEAGLSESGYRLVTNTGPDGCQEVPHFHTHILGGKKLDA